MRTTRTIVSFRVLLKTLPTFMIVLSMALAGGRVLAAQETAKAPERASLDSARVVRVRNWGGRSRQDTMTTAGPDTLPQTDSVRAGMDNLIVLVVRDLKSLVQRSKCLSADDRAVPNCIPQPIELYLDGREIKGLVPESGAPRPGDRYGTLRFHLQRSAESDETWADLLGAPPLDSRFWYRPTDVSVGLQGEYPVPSDVTAERFALIRIHPLWFLASVLFFGAVAILFFQYARRSDLLRDLGPNPAVGLKPYSLGRCQMAWWFMLVVGSFLFIFLVTRSYNTITDTTLVLIGISAGTFLGAAAIDMSAITVNGGDRQRLQTQSDVLTAEIVDLTARLSAPPPGTDLVILTQTRVAKSAELANVTKQLQAVMTAAQAKTSGGLLVDLLSDAQGQSFHRFQIVVWTLVLTMLFVISVWRRLAMPDFTSTMLGLLGISAGTYLGFKFPEQKS